MLKKSKIFLLAAVLILAFAQVAFPALNSVGPVLPDADGDPLNPPWSAGFNGYPTYYRDNLGQMAGFTNPPSPLSAPDPVDPLNPFSVQVGFGAEAFYWSSESTVAGQGVDALLVLALELAWGSEEPLPGDQVVFARVRIRVDTPVAGDYTVIHPYGQKVFTNVPVGVRTINDTLDFGLVPGNFAALLPGPIGPFLRQVGAAAGTFGDGTPAPVVNGTNGNIFRVLGPGGIDIQTNLFATTGEMFAGTPFNIIRTTYSNDPVNGAFAEIFTTTPTPFTPGTRLAARVVNASGAGAFVRMVRRGAGWFVRIPFDGVLPAEARVRGRTEGVNQTVLKSDLVDVVSIATAAFSVANQTLTITAASSDAVGPVTLTASGWTGGTPAAPAALVAGNLTVTGLVVPPVSVKVESSQGGVAEQAVTIVP